MFPYVESSSLERVYIIIILSMPGSVSHIVIVRHYPLLLTGRFRRTDYLVHVDQD